MEDWNLQPVSYPCDYPKHGSKLYWIARYFSSRAPEFGGIVPSAPLFSSRINITERTLARAVPVLRARFHYFIEPVPGRPGWYSCALSWPTFTRRKVYVSQGAFELEEVIEGDPRLYKPVPPPKKFPEPTPGTRIREVMTYLLRHRSSGTHWCDATWLYDKFGSAKIHRDIKALNRSYGFNIRKPISRLKDNMWIVEKQRNIRLPTKNNEAQIVELSEEWQEKFG